MENKLPQVAATLFSCEYEQRAYEWPGENRGFFTYFVEKGLKGQAADEDGRVTLSSLVTYLRREVPEQVKRVIGVDRLQIPWVKMEGDDPGSWVIVKVKAAERRIKDRSHGPFSESFFSAIFINLSLLLMGEMRALKTFLHSKTFLPTIKNILQ